jgi:hypothetical protein
MAQNKKLIIWEHNETKAAASSNSDLSWNQTEIYNVEPIKNVLKNIDFSKMKNTDKYMNNSNTNTANAYTNTKTKTDININPTLNLNLNLNYNRRFK